MVKRKIIQLNNYSFIVTLPKDWTELNNLGKGDEIHIESRGNNLIIKGKEDKDIETELDLRSIPHDIKWRYMVCAYRKGASKVSVKYSNHEDVQSIMKFIPDLMGWAIVSQDDEKIEIRDIMSIEDTNFDEMFRKVFLLIIKLSEDVYDGISSLNKKNLEKISYSDYNINKFSNICLRILNLRGYTDNTNSLYMIMSNLEEIADEYRKIVLFYPPKEINKDLLDIFKKVNDLLKLYYAIFYDLSKEKLLEFYNKADILLNDFRKFKRKDIEETKAYITLFTILHMLKSLAEEKLVINS